MSGKKKARPSSLWGPFEILQLWVHGPFKVHVAYGSVIDFNGDCLVNAANNLCLGGGGVDGEITRLGGNRLHQARASLPVVDGIRVETGDAKITIGGSLRQPWCIHAVGPDMRPSREDSQGLSEVEGLGLVKSAYSRSLTVAADHTLSPPIRSLAFSLISAGVFRGDLSLSQILEASLESVVEWIRARVSSGKTSNLENIFFVCYLGEEFCTIKNLWSLRPTPPVPNVSSRADNFVVGHSLPYVHRFIDAIKDPYTATNPHGKLVMAVAENKLAHDKLSERLNSFPGFSSSVFNYTMASGSPALKSSLVRFLSEFMFRGCDVRPENLIVAPGCCALLHALAYLLFESGDCILVPTPFYPAFDHDFLNLGRVSVVEVNCSDDGVPNFELTVSGLDEAFARADGKAKALLLTNPSNPLGTVYTRAQLELAIEWTRSRGLHLICDEIYALSCFSHLDMDNGAENEASEYPWESVASVLARQGQGLGEHVHVMWSLSKDFGASGFRVGCLYTQSATLLRALGSFADMEQVSMLAQEIAAFLLNDHTWVSSFLQLVRSRTRACYSVLKAGLAALPIPLAVIEAQAAIFVFVDARPMFSSFGQAEKNKRADRMVDHDTESDDGWIVEEALAAALYERSGVVVTPGRSCHCKVPGFFRMCYAWPGTIEAVEEVLRRLENFQKDLVGRG